MPESTSLASPPGYPAGRQQLALGPLAGAVAATLESWRTGDSIGRLWRRDAALWSGADEARWLGWLDAVATARTALPELIRIANEIRDASFAHAVVLGMGGSSLAPDVLRQTFGAIPGRPRLEVLDSTVPAQLRALEARINLAKTLFIVASKSGGTKEPNALYAHFSARLGGAAKAGRQFMAITDPGTKLEQLARADGFRHVIHGIPEVGGRFSALSAFGLVPAAIMGVDVGALLDRTAQMTRACAATVVPSENPGVSLGVVLAVAARAGRDKLSLTASPRLGSLGGWLEQLVAESTGKRGIGIVPVDGEELGPPDAYGNDRIFVHTQLGDDRNAEPALAALAAAGHPVIRINVMDPIELGGEWYRWEMATAAAGAVLGINPFDQPDVEAAKLATRELSEAYERFGSFAAPGAELTRAPSPAPLTAGERGIGNLTVGGADPALAARVADVAAGDAIDRLLAAHLNRLVPGDYFAINAFIEMSAANDRPLQALRQTVRDAKRVATTLGYGPRFLHSTGQLHKGGPATGLYLVLTADDPDDVAIPGERLTFATLKQAQALGDFAVLVERGRRALRLHLTAETAAALTTGLVDLGARVRRLLGKEA